ncbi:uncharacterized protein L3040_002528 [Drepanopeziza brunnea f. sp. 'multigermtubi']|uniref:Uncharacterized protein n=1 Tax=Marssonina brunnea f. sp. multigermtubi (strain MB_m1) TaxID=1072389 RepID=K1Y377_MARBU|nr:uncharacterized protein MBM_02831 [Drepanopeziza brunnea f. sp. 'multigermtubi' MB_m1]EKD19594.1 hypothetical protein MBM_02831 [Drepanopeziza brunnea f. sp. 'multigermtubi' MB_m1]KAJ5050653.1 hypothetical protein L3040_002528 [Drepanopeziza brunnea f. sp. 'multigermtubi']
MLSLHRPSQVLHVAELQSLIADFELQFEEHCCDDIAEEKLALLMRHEREELALVLCHEREEQARLERVQCRRDRYVMVLLKDHIACLLGGDEGMGEGMDEGSAVMRGGEDAGEQLAFKAEEKSVQRLKTEILDADSAEDEEVEKVELAAPRDHPVVPLLPRTTTRNGVGRDETVVLGSNRGQLTEYYVLRCERCPTKPFRPYAHDACELSALWRDHVNCLVVDQDHAVPSSIDVTGVFVWKIVDADDDWYETHLRGFHAGHQGWSTPDREYPPPESKGTPRASKVVDKDKNYRVKVKTGERSHRQALKKRSNEKESLTGDLERAATPTKINLKKNHEVTETPCAKPPTGYRRSSNGVPKSGSDSGRRRRSYTAIPIARKRGARHMIIAPAAAKKRPLSTTGAGSSFKRRVTPASQALRDGNVKRLRTDGLVGKAGP